MVLQSALTLSEGKILLSVRPNTTQKYLFNWIHPFISKAVLTVAAWPGLEQNRNN